MERNPKNAPGPFYVEKGMCISCDAPRHKAPGLVTLDDEVGCYFHRQPETSAEVELALRAMMTSCIEVYRYGGTEEAIRIRLAEAGLARLCDHPLDGLPVIRRRRARFSFDATSDARAMAAQLIGWFDAAPGGGACTTEATGDRDRVAFSYTHGRATRRAYVLERLRAVSAGRSAYRAPSDVPVWILDTDVTEYPPVGLHDLLVAHGATCVRWFSREEWLAGAPGRELPY